MISQLLQEFATEAGVKEHKYSASQKVEWSFEVMEITYKSRDRSSTLFSGADRDVSPQGWVLCNQGTSSTGR